MHREETREQTFPILLVIAGTVAIGAEKNPVPAATVQGLESVNYVHSSGGSEDSFWCWVQSLESRTFRFGA